MALGRGPSERGGVFAPVDLHAAGDLSWETVSRMSPGHPYVSGGVSGLGQYDVDAGRSQIVTMPESQMGPASGGVAAVPDAPGVALWDSWRDLGNFRGSPMPWLLLGALIVLGLMQFRVQARAGAFGRTASANAAVG